MSKLKHGGNLNDLSRAAGVPPDQILDFSANINPLGLPEWFRPVVSSALSSVIHYPDPEYTDLVTAASHRYKVDRDEIIVGNGSTEILHILPRILKKSRAIIPAPCYSDYATVCNIAGLQIEQPLLKAENDFKLDISELEPILDGTEVVFSASPNNPTGIVTDAEKIRRLASENPSTIFVIDEAFGDFVENMQSLAHNRPKNVVVLLSLTKIFAIPGLRLGCAVAEPAIVNEVKSVQPTWSVNTIAQAVGEASLKDLTYIENSRRYVTELRSKLQSELKTIHGIIAYPGRANFLLIHVERKDMNALDIAHRLLVDSKIAVRKCDNFNGLNSEYFRIAVRTEEENARLCEGLAKVLGSSRKIPIKRRTPAIMFQGTSSNAGKSVLTAALGRILLQDGHRVAPFKAQNMSLNSFVTRDGGEMGRAQVVQAQACKLDPDVRMNPVLLKPNSDTGSQVIIMGKPVGNMDVMDYVDYKPRAFEAVRKAYDSLASEYDIMVLEGAGSPAEVNLKHHDIVNMQMAKYAGAPVVLVGDIDRGGVFASFVGTMEVLAEWERSLIAGFLVNRFRGNKDLLADASDYTFRHTGKQILGIVPYFTNLGLPEEDSVSFKNGLIDKIQPTEDCVEIAVLDLPHISNFTDFDAFRVEPDVRLTIVRTPADLNSPDALIIPGSKNTIGDLDYVRRQGFHLKLRELVDNGTELVGICGGFQMIGNDISDPHGLETDSRALHGLGFLDVVTVLELEKTLTRMSAVHLESNLPVKGYEIHHGQSRNAAEPLLKCDNGGLDGAKSPDGKIWGTYFHGIFDEDKFRRWFIDRLRVRRGLTAKNVVCAGYDLEDAFDRLADSVRSSLNMKEIYRLLGL